LVHWFKCSKPLIIKVSWKNACNIILKFKLHMIMSFMKNNKARHHLKSWKSSPCARIEKKDIILHSRRTISERISSATSNKSKINSLRSKVPRANWFMMTRILISNAYHINIKSYNNPRILSHIRHQLQVMWRIRCIKCQLRYKKK
jgi:hypothetical protein